MIHEGHQVETLKRAAKVDNTGDNGQTTMFNLDVQLWWQCKTLKLSIYTCYCLDPSSRSNFHFKGTIRNICIIDHGRGGGLTVFSLLAPQVL